MILTISSLGGGIIWPEIDVMTDDVT